jgi:hypothetical protein
VLGKDSQMTSNPAKCRGSRSIRPNVGSSRGWGMGYRPMQLQMMGTRGTFIFAMSPAVSSSLRRDFAPSHVLNLLESYHTCTIDNLFNSVKLAPAAYSLPKPVLVHGVLRQSGRGCPPCVIQEEKLGKHTNAARSTVKAAVLKGDSMSSDLVIALCYDQKPFYMISTKVEKVSWELIVKKVWSTELKSNVDFAFLRWSLSHDYNYQMNDNDIADQLRLVY